MRDSEVQRRRLALLRDRNEQEHAPLRFRVDHSEPVSFPGPRMSRSRNFLVREIKLDKSKFKMLKRSAIDPAIKRI
jgi:hypothetical protein